MRTKNRNEIMKKEPYRFSYDFIVITGPTGVGKTELALALGNELPIEIINGDMGQLYTPLTIGTAKPLWKEEKTPHHLFDILDVPYNYTAANYRDRVRCLLREIRQRNALPVIVGGSGFYIRSLFFFSPHVLQPAPSKILCDDKPVSDNSLSGSKSAAISQWNRLKLVDPGRAAAIHPHDSYRINRALEIWESSGTMPSLHKPVYASLGKALVIMVHRDRDELYTNINRRVLAMLNQGWRQEVAALLPEWQAFVMEKKIIGYPEIVGSLREGRDVDASLIQQRTRQYAKRQITFLKKLEKDLVHLRDNSVVVETVNLTFLPLALYIDQLSKRILTP